MEGKGIYVHRDSKISQSLVFAKRRKFYEHFGTMSEKCQTKQELWRFEVHSSTNGRIFAKRNQRRSVEKECVY